MADAATFEIIITALDKATANLNRIHANIEGFVSPIGNVGSALENLGQASGLAQLGEKVEGLGAKFMGLGQAAGALAGPLSLALGGLSIAGIIGVAKHAADYGAELYVASEKTGVAVEQLARLHYVADENGASTQELDKGLAHLNKTIGDVATGHNKQALDTFRHLGIDIHDSTGHLRTAASVWGDLAEAIQKNENATVRERIVTDAFGARMGANLIPMLELGRDRTDELGDEFDQLHGKMTQQMAKDAKEASDNWKRVSAALEGVGNAIGNALLPMITPALDWVEKFASANRDLAASLAIAGAGFLGAALLIGPLTSGFVAIVGIAGSLTGIFATAIIGVVGFLGDLVVALNLGFGAFAAFDLALDANPIGLIVIAVAALAAAAYELYEHWEPVEDFFVGLWDDVKGAFKWAYDNILPLIPGGQMVHDIFSNWDHVAPYFDRIWKEIVAIFEKAYDKIAPIITALKWFSGVSEAEWVGGLFEDTAAHGKAILAHDNPAAASHVASAPAIQFAGSGAGAGRDGQVHIMVDFANQPPGTQTKTEASGGLLGQLDVGHSWAF
jgi:hypothetical protein